MKVGIAGTDENRMVDHARAGLGIAGDTGKGKVLAGARFGAAGLNDKQIVAAGHSAFGISGLDRTSLRSLLAAYQGLWTWPPPEPLPLDLLDTAQVEDLRGRFQTAQLELGI